MKGKSILVLRPSHQTDDIETKLRALGAEPISAPAIEIGAPLDWGPVDRAIEGLAGFDWVLFTSVNGVTSVVGRAQELGSYDRLRNSLDDGPRVGAVGPATAEAIQALGARAWTPPSFTTESFSEELPTSGGRVLVFRAASADHRLEEILGGRGFEVVRADAYSTANADPQPIRNALDEGVDAVLVTSASIAKAFARASAQGAARTIESTIIASIGPATTTECQRLGIEVDVEASEHTTAGLIEALATYFADNP